MKKTLIAISLLAMTHQALAAETPLGEDVIQNGMVIGAVYLQAVRMDVMPKIQGDSHFEIDIHAAKGNRNGFAQGEWIPYLTINYTLSKKGSDWQTKGSLMPMVANDGPHYGANIKLDGAGMYHIDYEILPPSPNAPSCQSPKTMTLCFARHIDRETGVAPWFKPISLKYDFAWAPTGKKGGY
ncbi:iron transporter [uncultured Shewanella sp.]|uniref:iron transporter n=1 Tax=uncultured Shewanella sp. TaxID=173975 RepID=UPI002624F7F7|nr:iron transporter [uncultured Shewanella sp.]